MQEKQPHTFHDACNHLEASKREIRAMCKKLFPPAFWKHAERARQEAKLARKAMYRAAKRSISLKPSRKIPAGHKIDIS